MNWRRHRFSRGSYYGFRASGLLFFDQLEELKPYIDLPDVVVLLVLRAHERGADRTHYFLYRAYQIIAEERTDTRAGRSDKQRRY